MLAALFALTIASLTPVAANAQQEAEWHHGLSLFGELKYGPDFKHFDYVNPDAPKGGTLRMSAAGTFDSLNPFIVKGVPAGASAAIYDTLMESAYDEPSAKYGLVAESVSYPDDFSSVTFKLRPEARWHDGKPITPEDIIWSLETLKKSHPFYNAYYRNVTSAEVTGEHEVTFRFDQKGNRELPLITSEFPILPKHYWEAEGRDFSATTLEPPLGSSAYKIGEIQPGRSITLERVDDYWAKDLPVNIGRHNFKSIRYEYFRDSTVALEAFKADAFDIRLENSAKNWATAYDFPAVQRGDVIAEVFKAKNAEPMQGLVFNLRREKFADPRVREAFNYAFDFEWLNANIFYGQYQRTGSYFANSELAATGLPEGLELEMLEPLRGKVPEEVFTTPFENPVGGDTRQMRTNLRKARDLLEAAGWRIGNSNGHQALVNDKGEPFNVEFLLVQPDMERIVAPYIQNLEKLGINASIRTVDSAQYQERMDSFDYDMTTAVFQQSLSPGNEQREFWGSEAADMRGSRNVMGIKNPAVDTLIQKIIFAEDRAHLVAASKALDRVLLWNHYLVPQFYFAGDRVARWDRFGLPETLPDYVFTTDNWWWDEAKAAKIKGAN
ncbi:MAG: ABC transporter substrate-binding protein [Rhodobiaceae bacterium]|nr:ABC transporter substrate-binding protein [Rhodobiaceae bacterium]MCC0055126.1 ABC transporter substrate-binding protein [Rhodobiaceae bacterium]